MKDDHRLVIVAVATAVCVFLAGCAASGVKRKYEQLGKQESERYEQEQALLIAEIEQLTFEFADAALHQRLADNINQCGQDGECITQQNSQFIRDLERRYSQANFNEVFARCHNTCRSPAQLEYVAGISDLESRRTELSNRLDTAKRRHDKRLASLQVSFTEEYQRALEQNRQTAMAIAAGLQAAAYSMAQTSAAYQQSYTNYYPTSYGYSAARPSNRFTYYSGSLSGTTQQIGHFSYHNFSSGLSGTTQRIGNFQYHNFNNGMSGTTQRVGQFQYHNFNSGITGTTQNIGSFDYTNFSDGTRCTTQYIGSFAYTNCN